MAKFTKGHKMSQNQKGKPKQGRPPKWFKDRCAKIATSYTALKFMEDCLEGKDVDIKVTKDGDVLTVAPGASVRLHAWAELADRGYGKAAQSVELSGDSFISAAQLAQILNKERVARGLKD